MNCRKRPIEELDWSKTNISDTLVDITTLGPNDRVYVITQDGQELMLSREEYKNWNEEPFAAGPYLMTGVPEEEVITIPTEIDWVEVNELQDDEDVLVHLPDGVTGHLTKTDLQRWDGPQFACGAYHVIRQGEMLAVMPTGMRQYMDTREWPS